MANASVDKLKALGLRHGEKAVVGLAATLFVVFAGLGIIHPTLDMKPEQLSTQATAARSNLDRPQAEADILAKIEEAGIKDPGFVKLVENQVSNALKPGDYRTKLDWITPEPGAGLIRDQPEMIAPTELAAFPGRGGILLYALDDKGQRILATGEEAKKGRRKGGPARGRRAGGPGPLAGGQGPLGGPGGGPERPEDAKKREAEKAKLERSLAGKAAAPKEKDKAAEPKAEDAATESQGPWKEETKGKRWIVVTAVIDHEQMRKNWLKALKNPAIAYPSYVKADLERQVRTDDAWSDWAAVDPDKNYAVLDNITEGDTEFVPEPKRPPNLVDPLPFLRAGYWTGVHVARLVPPDATKDAASGTSGGSSPVRGGAGMGPMSRTGGNSGTAGEGPGSGSGGRAGMSPGGGSAEGGPEVPFEVNDEPAFMIRSLDFTVEPNQTYRFRLRIVCLNPNKDHTDVNPGVDTESKELIGPWSATSDEVTVPADVAAYAQAPEPTERRNDQMIFQVVRWNPATGQTVIKTDDAWPGQVIGEFGPVQEPSSEGGGAKSTYIDFNSRSIVLDTMGGREPAANMPDMGVEKNSNVTPAMALVIQPDGSVIVRSQSRDKVDDVRRDMDSSYRQALADSSVKRESGTGGSRYPGAGGGRRGGGKRKGRGRR